jgi:hypothetical protein
VEVYYAKSTLAYAEAEDDPVAGVTGCPGATWSGFQITEQSHNPPEGVHCRIEGSFGSVDLVDICNDLGSYTATAITANDCVIRTESVVAPGCHTIGTAEASSSAQGTGN